MGYSAHVDRFTEQAMPPPEDLPEFLFTLDDLHVPERLNAVDELLGRWLTGESAQRRALVAADGTTWTYAQLAARAAQISAVLSEDFGIVPGNRVLLRGYNSPALAAAWLGVLACGAVAVTTMPLYRSAELQYMMDRAQVSLALCDERLLDDLRAASASVPIVTFGHKGADLETRMRAKPETLKCVPTAALDVAIIGFTSGTTGRAKAAMHTHRDIVATCRTFGRRVLQANSDDLFCGSPPLGFTFGLGGLLLFPLDAGAATLLLEKTKPEDLAPAIERHKVTVLFTAPMAYRALCKATQHYNMDSLRACVSAGETLPKAVWDEWHARTAVPIIDGIGSTEMLHIFIGSPAAQARPGSTGRVVPGYVAEIHDDDGRPLADGEVGRLAVKGPTGCKYLDDDRQHTYVQNGWNYPGDAYRRDAEGYFYYVARTDDMIIAAGYNISGPEVEQALLTHADVVDCAVVAKPQPERGTNIVKAYVVLGADAVASPEKEQELIAFCRDTIAAYKAPREIEFVNVLPRTETGKVQRYKLRQQAAT